MSIGRFAREVQHLGEPEREGAVRGDGGTRGLHFLERSHVLFLGRPGTILETQIAPHLRPFDKGTSVRDVFYGGDSGSLSISPIVMVRILKERSAPVRTPSFLPKATYQRIELKHRRRGEQWGDWVRLRSLQFTLGHHSNGQDGCILLDAALPDCVPTSDAIRINRTSGSFSTNYFRVGYYRRYHRLDKPQPEPGGGAIAFRHVVHTLSGGIAFETHPAWLGLGGTLEQPFRDIYGTNRLLAELEYEKPLRARVLGVGLAGVRLGASGQFVRKKRNSQDCAVAGATGFEANSCAPRFGLGAEAALRFDRIDELALYLRYQHAQDPYNLGFTHLNHQLQFGLTFDVGRTAALRLPVIDEAVLEEERAIQKGKAWKAYRKANREWCRENCPKSS
jgi:hypothetical protein